MMRTVFAECKLNIPFDSHQSIFNLISANGGSMGNYHYEKTSAQRMLVTISELMHSRFIRHICAKDVGPISLIADGSTTYQGDHYFIVYLMALEDDKTDEEVLSARPVVYFYKLQKMPSADESADEYKRQLTAAFAEDGQKYNVGVARSLQKNLIDLGTDGASVMSRRQGGLIKH